MEPDDTLKNDVTLIDVNASNVSETGYFCYMSKKKSEGYRRKLAWLKQRFAEGLRIKMLGQGQRGFIEYIPGEYAWRTVNAKGYMLIHCLWVVGKSKGNGYAGLLLNECIKDAQKSKMKGVAIVTSKGNWLVGNKLLLAHGFESVGSAPPSFELLVKKFTKVQSPSFSINWDRRRRKFGKGITLTRSDQCPYLEDATRIIKETADEMGIQSQVIDIKSSRDVQKKSPSAYGVFSITYNGSLLSYHYLTKKEFQKRIKELT
jgi:hypothetical protein